MAIETVSIGNELKDSFQPTSKWIEIGINWINDIEDFYRERAAIEKDCANKLKELCKKHFDKKSANSTRLSVGDEPQVTPGSLECSSLVLWTDVLSQTEAIADEKLLVSREMERKLCENFSLLRDKSSRISKHIAIIEEFLTGEKKKTEEVVQKSKNSYDSLCQATENARQKTEKSSGDKYQQRLQAKEVDMNIGKNEYLINISIANRLKDKYYYQDVPELLDYYQELNEDRVTIMNKLLKNASIIERNSLDRIKLKLNNIDVTIEENDPHLDTMMFVKHNVKNWKEPQDFYFIPSDIWHDDESLVTKEPELTELKKRLNLSSLNYSKFEDTCMEAKQSLEEISLLRKEEIGNITLKFDAKFINSLSYLQKFLKADGERIKNEVEIEIIQNFAGDKDLTYVAQTSPKKSRLGFLKHKKTKLTSGVSTEDDIQSLRTLKSASSQKTSNSGFFNLRKNKTHASNSDNADAIGLFEYLASGDDEVSISPGDPISILDNDDGSGWTMIKNIEGKEGLVPTTYLEIRKQFAVETTQKKKGPSVAPRRGAKRIQYLEALYDYTADGEDELTIKVGDRIILVQDDTNGSGWTEGELNGQTGMFPSSYVSKI